MARAGFPAVAIPPSAARDVQIAVQNIRARLEALESSYAPSKTVNAQIAAVSAQIGTSSSSSSSSGIAGAQTGALTVTGNENVTGTLTVTGDVFAPNILNFTASASAPGSPNVGDRWVNTSNGVQYTWFNDGSGNQWVQFT